PRRAGTASRHPHLEWPSSAEPGRWAAPGEPDTPHVEVLLYLLADLVIIIVAARLFGALARWVKQPGGIGEGGPGSLRGPTALGRVAPSAPAWIFPPEVPLKEIADLGLVFFMFMVGLEIDAGLMKKEGRRAVQISLAGVVTPFVLGALLALA